MTNVVVVDAIRTPIGAVHGAFVEHQPVDLLGATIAAVVSRAGVDPAAIGEIIVGCTEPVGAQSGNVARGAGLAAGVPASVGATTIDRGATSGAQALLLAVALVSAGIHRAVVAAAVDIMSLVPAGAAAMGRHPYGRPWTAAVTNGAPTVPPGVATEALAARLGIDRVEQDCWAAASVTAALAPRSVAARTAERHPAGPDEILATRPHDAEACGAFRPLHDADGTVTAANSAPPADGAAALIVADAEWLAEQHRSPLARVRTVASAAGAGDDPLGPAAAAARLALRRSGVEVDQLTAIELHEPSAVVAIALQQALGFDRSIINVQGGALALGDPPATSGIRTAVTLAHLLAATGGGGLHIVPGLGLGTAIVLDGRRVPDEE
jgi:acetyl-CoA acetyltransferase family protein